MIRRFIDRLMARLGYVSRKEHEDAIHALATRDDYITGLNVGSGGIELGFEGGPAQFIAGLLTGFMRDFPPEIAPNYVSMIVEDPKSQQQWRVLIQRQHGRSPENLLADAQARIKRLEAELAEARST